jgi:hypothetical protein
MPSSTLSGHTKINLVIRCRRYSGTKDPSSVAIASISLKQVLGYSSRNQKSQVPEMYSCEGGEDYCDELNFRGTSPAARL